jgi:NADH dehydrogenase
MALQLPETHKKRVVIIGCGFGGLELARTLSGKGFQIVLFDKNNYHTFQPLLYQVATAGLEADSIAYPIRKIFRDNTDVFFRWAEVENINTAEQKIHTSIGDCSYDYLVIATGTTTNFFNNSAIAENAMPMKTVVEALNLRSLILQNLEKATLAEDELERKALMTYAIVGGGPTGVELAGALCELKKHVLPNDYPELDFTHMDVLLIESGGEVLQNLCKENQTKAIHYLNDLGATVLLNTRVASYDGKVINTSEGKIINTYTLIWAAGVKGNEISGFDGMVLTSGKRYLVNESCQINGFKNVFAIGDIACICTEAFPKGHPQVAPVAIQQGTLVAENIQAITESKALKKFVYNDKGSMATVGRNRAVVETGKIKFGGIFGWFAWMAVHLMQLVGFRNRIVVFINWVWNYINYDRNIRLIIRPFEKKNYS